MQGIQFLLMPFVWILQVFYNLFNNYGIALILFALLVKVIMFPLSLKGKRSMIQMNMLNGRMQKLQKMYGNNQEKYQLEVQKLYEKEGVNPMGGCLWSLLPVLIIFPLYAIIRQPLTYMMNLTPEQIVEVGNNVLNWAQASIDHGWVKNVTDVTKNLLTTETMSMGYNQLYLTSLINAGNIDAVRALVGESAFVVNFSFLGIDLAMIPQLKFWEGGLSWGSIGLFLLPVISAATSLVFSLVSNKTNAVNQQSANAQANTSNKMLLLLSPLMSLWIGFGMPAALSVYWIANSLLSMLQEFIAGKMLKKDYEKARLEQERRAIEEKEEEKRLKEEARQERARRLEEQKKNKGKKKAPKKEDATPGVNKEASREGLRAYARGRAYDPYRFSPDGPTPYRDSSFAVDDAAVEKALEEKEEAREKAEFAEKYQLTEEDMKELEQELPEEEAATPPEETDGGEDQPEL